VRIKSLDVITLNNKVIIWGYKLHSHTHSYIHNGYYKAFKKMGYDTYWFDDNDNVSGFDFQNCVFFTVGREENNIPLNDSSYYILHHIKDMTKYLAASVNYINLGNYLSSCDNGISSNHPENTVIKIGGECCFWDEKTRTIYQPWATDLTPDEINLDDALNYDPNNSMINFIGTINENMNQIREFLNSLPVDKTLNIIGHQSDENNRLFVRNSLISFDIRNDWHVECGYLPCRVFKNISYGRLTGTNSLNVKKVFGEHVIYEPNLTLLYNKLIEAEEKISIDKIKAAMDFVKNNHTFVNRVNNLIKCFEIC
jgi:hypothetical protein